MADVTRKAKRGHQRLSWFLRRQIVLEYLQGDKTLRQLSESYGIPNQSISRWVKDYERDIGKRNVRILTDMTPKEQEEYEALKQQNEALKKDLEFAQMKALAMETIIDLAKEEYGIDLRKNSGAKQPVSLKTATRRQK